MSFSNSLENELETILKRRKNGETVSAIAKDLQISRSTLYKKYPQIVNGVKNVSVSSTSRPSTSTTTDTNISNTSFKSFNSDRSDVALKDFKVYRVLEYKDTIDFSHPFTCKCLGSRGSGKTTFVVLYLNNSNVLNEYDRVIWFTTTSHQDLLDILNPFARSNVEFKEPYEIEQVYTEITELQEPMEKVLLIFDDCMQEKSIRNSKTVMAMYTKGRHLGVSLISLEQHMNYSSNVERGNTDYYLLFSINDSLALDTFRMKFCCEYKQDDFMKMYRYCVDAFQPLIISFKGRYKFRCEFNKEIAVQDSVLKFKEILKSDTEPITPKNLKRKKNKNKFWYYLLCCISVIFD